MSFIFGREAPVQTPKAVKEPVLRIELAKDQQAQVKRATSRDGVVVELTVQELEERIAPGFTENHNETLLADR